MAVNTLKWLLSFKAILSFVYYTVKNHIKNGGKTDEEMPKLWHKKLRFC